MPTIVQMLINYISIILLGQVTLSYGLELTSKAKYIIAIKLITVDRHFLCPYVALKGLAVCMYLFHIISKK